ncbi:MAG: hypothetical protein K6E91_12610 [Butyrivibrio sp.]|nr:hypothetical protein [Butyrivibrio sp.]
MSSKTLRLPKLISDGMVIQRRKSIHVWGWNEPGSEVAATICEVTASGITDETGRFDLYLPARESGGPYELIVRDDRGNEEIIRDVFIGLVWFCTGQSNMELPVARVKDRYPFFNDIEENTQVRTFKIVEDSDFCTPLEELGSGSWSHVSKDTIMNFSATGYFFAQNLQKITGLTVGFINASLGGSRISSWLGRDMLQGYDELLAEADRYADEAFRKSVMNDNATYPQRWRDELDKNDKGLSLGWKDPQFDDSSWKSMNIPVMFDDTPLKGFIGAVWFRRKFDLPDELAGKPARLFLGTLVDRDEVFVNGVKVGGIEYQYPPRKYDIPEGLTVKEGNTIVIRLCVETGLGRITPGKDYMIFNEKAATRLEGDWRYEIGAVCGAIPPTDFINWKPTGLYNAMTAPCHNYPVDGIIWYQGESNTHEPYDYVDLSRRMISGYRKKWNEENLPYIFVQLPNFVIDVESVSDPWPQFRLDQKKLLDDPNVGMAVTMDAGEDNDLHPTMKEPIGQRLAVYAARLKYGYGGEYTGPEIQSAVILEDDETAQASEKEAASIELTFTHCAGLCSRALDKGEEIKDFEIVDADGKITNARAFIQGEKIILRTKVGADKIMGIRYLVSYTYKGAMIYNSAGFPMGPFEIGKDYFAAR